MVMTPEKQVQWTYIFFKRDTKISIGKVLLYLDGKLYNDLPDFVKKQLIEIREFTKLLHNRYPYIYKMLFFKLKLHGIKWHFTMS